jgi:hypothetical protein
LGSLDDLYFLKGFCDFPGFEYLLTGKVRDGISCLIGSFILNYGAFWRDVRVV